MKGLYKKISDTELICAANTINHPDGTVINVSDFENHVGEVSDGWYWFNSEIEAKAAFDISEPIPPKPLIPTTSWPAQ